MTERHESLTTVPPVKAHQPAPVKMGHANTIPPMIPIQHPSTVLKSRRSTDLRGRVVLAALTLLGAGCTGGREVTQNWSQPAAQTHLPQNPFDARIQLTDTAEQAPWGLTNSGLPPLISPARPPRIDTAGQDAARRRAADEQMERFRNQRAFAQAQARLTAAWNRALVSAAWQQVLQQQLFSGQGGGQSGPHRTYATGELSGVSVVGDTGVLTSGAGWYPGR
jgi:hypothetical protein